MRFDNPWLSQPLSKLEMAFNVVLVLLFIGLLTVVFVWGR